jgi:flagella basal body P-ring formation protein FlgA
MMANAAVAGVMVVIAIAAATTVVRTEAAPAVLASDVEAAIARAVSERIGGTPQVSVTKLQLGFALKGGTNSPIDKTIDGTITASPEPGARIGTPARFTLFAGGSRIGSAGAVVQVTATHVRARRAMARLEELGAGDVEEITGALKDQPIRHLPAAADVIGARLKRNVVAGEPITSAVIEVPTAVKSGDLIAVTVRMGAVEAEGRAVASGSGHVGDLVRVVPPGTRRVLKARIVGPGRAEIIQ